jgi:ribosomal protein S18 acetylase RimI-like enzyme
MPPSVAGGSGPPTLVLRPLRWADFEPLVTIYYDLYEERAEGEPIGIHLFHRRPSRADEVDWFARLYRRVLTEELVVVVAELDGQPVGQCTVEPAGGIRESETGHVGVLGLVVDRHHRGQGIGSALVRRAVEECRGRFEQVRLSVFVDNERAKGLYERAGFRVHGRIPRAVKRGNRYIDEEVMALDLEGASPADAPRNR